MVHQRATLREKREHMTMAAKVPDLLHLGEDIVIVGAFVARDALPDDILVAQQLGLHAQGAE
jgi:hypothetical protein